MCIRDRGTGKEVFANAIHNNGEQREKPMVSINCAAIPNELLESELFGYEEGAFTGAKKGGKKDVYKRQVLSIAPIAEMPCSAALISKQDNLHPLSAPLISVRRFLPPFIWWKEKFWKPSPCCLLYTSRCV